MRPYRWQDPPPPPVQSIKLRRMELEYFRSADKKPGTIALPVQQMPAPVPSMVIEGVEYVEAPEHNSSCQGCVFEHCSAYQCMDIQEEAERVLSASCSDRRVIYIRKA